ncbi:MAG: UDP-glucose 4-epimerase GalE [Coriobacteriales bacterium]|jgi:UDP-glucose 4-epimerase|nr:UDP-glucose 4-epimerase GalE [Coriobacteriales bacterium]
MQLEAQDTPAQIPKTRAHLKSEAGTSTHPSRLTSAKTNSLSHMNRASDSGLNLKVLVVGGAGYIGSHTVYELIRNGHQVVVYDNLSSGHQSAVPEQAGFYLGDILDEHQLEQVLAQESASRPFDVAMHFAAKLIVPESVTQPLRYYHNNVEGLRVMLSALVAGGVRNIVFSSTAAVYGSTTGGECHEDDRTIPINPYGETKLAAERMIAWTAQAHGLNYAILRYFNVAGADTSLQIGLNKDQLTHLVPLIMQAALGQREKLEIFGRDYNTPDGTCIRDYVHVTDLAQAHVMAGEYIVKNERPLLCNLGSGRGFSVREVVEEALSMFSFRYAYAPRRCGDPAKLIANIERARHLLGWQPQRNLQTILQSDYDYRRRLISGQEPASQ